MTEEYGGFASARVRLEEIAAQASAKDTPLEKAIELLEEGARIAHRCTELLDHTEWRSVVEGEDEPEGEAPAAGTGDGSREDTGEDEGEAGEPGGAGAEPEGG